MAKKTMEAEKRKHGTDEGSRRGGETTRAKYYPYEGRAVYMRLRVDAEAAEIVKTIPATERSQFFTEAITNEMLRRQKGREVA